MQSWPTSTDFVHLITNQLKPPSWQTVAASKLKSVHFYRLMSILVNNVSDTIINTFMIIAMIVGFFQLKHLRIVHLEVCQEVKKSGFYL